MSFFLEDDSKNSAKFNGKAIAFTLQLIKLWFEKNQFNRLWTCNQIRKPLLLFTKHTDTLVDQTETKP